VNQPLARTKATSRSRRALNCGQLLAAMTIALTSACAGRPLAPSAAPAVSPTPPPVEKAPAIERYKPVVKRDNTSSLQGIALPFATYINAIHTRLHPAFAEELAAFNLLPRSQALSGDLITVLEAAVSPADGRLVRVGIVRGSGVTAFDTAALNAIDHAQPFGKAPDVIVSYDGKVYLHWEFHRDPNDACTTRNAFPYLLHSAP
jgi:TonB family protein